MQLVEYLLKNVFNVNIIYIILYHLSQSISSIFSIFSQVEFGTNFFIFIKLKELFRIVYFVKDIYDCNSAIHMVVVYPLCSLYQHSRETYVYAIHNCCVFKDCFCFKSKGTQFSAHYIFNLKCIPSSNYA